MSGRVIFANQKSKTHLPHRRIANALGARIALRIAAFFVCESYYINAVDTRKHQEIDKTYLSPRIDNLTSRVVTTSNEADELEAQGFRFRPYNWGARERLDNGAIAICTFVGPELGCISWVAMTEKAKRSLIGLPIRVNFNRNEAFAGGILTIGKYRGIGLMGYNSLKRYEFLRNRGIITAIGAIRKDNIVSLKGLAKVGVKPCAEARYLKILWWKFWREKLLTEAVA